MNTVTPLELELLYARRFERRKQYRLEVWQTLIRHYFGRFIPSEGTVLDLGCGQGEFINQVDCGMRFGMDLNPGTRAVLADDVRFLEQDCSAPWQLSDGSLDTVFTSNFFEHLPCKQTLSDTLCQAYRCLKPGGRLIAMGPNIRYVPGAYWDFWDHFLPLTERSLSEGMRLQGFRIDVCIPRFLPYTMTGARKHPIFLIAAYLHLPLAWRLFGKQFLVIGVRDARE